MMHRREFLNAAVAAAVLGGLGPARAAASALTSDDALSARLAEIEAASGGRLGVAVLDTGSGRLTAHRGDERFPMCSTFKLLAVAAVLHRVDEGEESLDRQILVPADGIQEYAPVTENHAGEKMTLDALCEAVMAWSDNTAANLILTSLGGPEAATAYVRALGDDKTRIDRYEPDANIIASGDPRDTTTPIAMVRDLNRLALGDALSEKSRKQLTAWLIANETGKDRLRAGLPDGWRAGDRTGTGPDGTSNDVAICWPPDRPPLLIAAYLTASPEDRPARDSVLAAVGKAASAG
ncbi:class A beta-lactamase [Methyloligella sp. 2.7D]|uniref:class A beta-lactamase n=1 Tax=unclassified Methyloligella TaxID=2625955 RepID=UPI00157CF2F2|nr:class A beta-lactamase [Methyloligella sp. GL2]QKP78046.1 class A beta-lactamase [Methyloligella sp. GL2]